MGALSRRAGAGQWNCSHQNREPPARAGRTELLPLPPADRLPPSVAGYALVASRARARGRTGALRPRSPRPLQLPPCDPPCLTYTAPSMLTGLSQRLLTVLQLTRMALVF